MTDNGSPYVSSASAAFCAASGITHIRTRPYQPRTNGKAERFIQTMLREWAHAATYRNSCQRTRALRHGSATTTNHAPTAPSDTRRPPVGYSPTDELSWELQLPPHPRYDGALRWQVVKAQSK
jgi:transposase InsO family protein